MSLPIAFFARCSIGLVFLHLWTPLRDSNPQRRYQGLTEIRQVGSYGRKSWESAQGSLVINHDGTPPNQSCLMQESLPATVGSKNSSVPTVCCDESRLNCPSLRSG